MVIPDLYLANLSLWLFEFDAGPVVFRSFRATISTKPQSELVLITEYFIDRDQEVFEVELVDCWEVSVLPALDLPTTRSRESVREFLGFNRDNMLSTADDRLLGL